MKAVIMTYANDPDYLALVNQPVGYVAGGPAAQGGNGDNMMGNVHRRRDLQLLERDDELDERRRPVLQ